MFDIHAKTLFTPVLLCLVLASPLTAQDWPQWRGPNRDARATGFRAPDSWPENLTQKWRVEVGEGVSTPALVGDRLFVLARQEGEEILRCLEAATGKEIWRDSHTADAVRGPASRFSGPRSSPTVAGGKVVTLGVQGTLSCHDAASGKLLWRHEEYRGAVPRFATSSSPIVVGDLCIAQLGSDRGGVMAYDLATGKEQWTWTGDGPAYGSPVLTTVDGTKVIVTPTDGNLVALDARSGELLWKTPYSQGRYNAATPIVQGQTLIVAGPTRGMTAHRLMKAGDVLAEEPLWNNTENSVQFNTPVLREGLLFGLSNQNSLFCIDLKDGQTAWSAPLSEASNQESEGREERGRGRGEGGRRGRRGRGGGGYGSVVDAGSVLVALTPAGELTVFKPTREKLERIASYKVAGGQTYAYPVIAGNRIFIKDEDSVTLWTVD